MLNNKLYYCVVGLGITGISCIEFLLRNNITNIAATDLQNTEPLQKLAEKYPTVKFLLGDLIIPEETDSIILSPGINRFLPVIQEAVLNGATLTNDINFFLEQINNFKKNKNLKVAAVTGTNGKTTVVHILAAMAKEAGIKYALCGNVGSPVLNYLPTEDQQIELYILELSSFQLELVDHLYCDVACILNITPDHLDRYQDFSSYCEAKLKIYANAKNLVYYREDLYNSIKDNAISFGKNYTGKPGDYSLSEDYTYLMRDEHKILPVNQIKIKGEHNLLNALAALAIGDLLEFPEESMHVVLKSFKGLEHRYEHVGKFNDNILWINDSKGTNIGATLVAINTTVKTPEYTPKNLIIILGGLNKNVDLNMLKPMVVTYCKAAILLGECKEQLFNILASNIDCYVVEDLNVAVLTAKKIASDGDIVLLSPGCASFDMFDNYQHRGEVFKKSVLSLYHEQNS